LAGRKQPWTENIKTLVVIGQHIFLKFALVFLENLVARRSFKWWLARISNVQACSLLAGTLP